jgi:hypothetical protein
VRIRWTPSAAADLANISDYLNVHHPQYQTATIERLYQGIRSLSQRSESIARRRTGSSLHRFRNATTANGGNVTAMLFSRLCLGIGLDDTIPPFPRFVPPKSSESVFKISS